MEDRRSKAQIALEALREQGTAADLGAALPGSSGPDLPSSASFSCQLLLPGHPAAGTPPQTVPKPAAGIIPSSRFGTSDGRPRLQVLALNKE